MEIAPKANAPATRLQDLRVGDTIAVISGDDVVPDEIERVTKQRITLLVRGATYCRVTEECRIDRLGRSCSRVAPWVRAHEDRFLGPWGALGKPSDYDTSGGGFLTIGKREHEVLAVEIIEWLQEHGDDWAPVPVSDLSWKSRLCLKPLDNGDYFTIPRLWIEAMQSMRLQTASPRRCQPCRAR